jgi:hypothetical protein
MARYVRICPTNADKKRQRLPEIRCDGLHSQEGINSGALNKMEKKETMGMMKRKRNQGRAAEPVATGLDGRDTIGPVTDW